MAEYFGVARPTHPRPLHNAISTRNEGSACPGGRQAQPGVATGQSVLAWRLGYAEVLVSRFHLRSNSELSSVKLIQTKKIFGNVNLIIFIKKESKFLFLYVSLKIKFLSKYLLFNSSRLFSLIFKFKNLKCFIISILIFLGTSHR